MHWLRIPGAAVARRVVAVAGIAALGVGIAVPAQSVVPAALAVTAAGPAGLVKAADVTGETTAVSVAVTVAGGQAPYTWTARTLVYPSADVGVAVLASSADPGAAVLEAGKAVPVRAGTTKSLGYAGAWQVAVTVKDAAGASATATATVEVVSKVSRPKVAGASGKLSRPGAKRAVWGRASEEMRGRPLAVYLKKPGAESYKKIGTAKVNANGTWRLRSAKVKAGAYYAKTASKYVVTVKSKAKRIPAKSFKAKAPAWLTAPVG
jgi:hypothetical protein